MPIDPDFLVPGGALANPLIAELVGTRTIAVGERVGPYRVLGEIGRGGMSVVYHAERVDGAFEQEVALKVLRPDLASKRAGELLRRERRILARLEHPGIARIIDGGSTDDGALWFAMERVVGEPIDDWCRQRRLAARERAALFLEVCDAVRHAHARLHIHRDIKASNILVDEDGRVRLLDFGIAGLISGDAAEGPVAGTLTPGVASPEQQRGDVESTATDIYQLGRLLDHLLRSDALQPALQRTDELQSIIACATAADPARRYDTVVALAADVGAWSRGFPVSRFSTRTGYRLRRFVGRHRLGAALVALGLIVLAGSTWISLSRIQHARTLAEAAQARAESAASRAEKVSAFLVQTLSDAKPESLGREPRVDDLLAGAARRARTTLVGQPELRATVSATLADIHINRMDFAAALPLLQDAVELAAQTVDMPATRLANLELRLAVALQSANDLDAAERYYALALERITKAAPGSMAHRVTLRNIAQFHVRRGEYDDALRLARSVVSMHEADRDTAVGSLVGDLSNLGQIEGLAGHPAAKRSLVARACATARAGGLELGAAGIFACNAHADALREADDLDGAERELVQVHAAALALYGEDNAVPAGIDTSFAEVELRRGRWVDAEAHARRALAAFAKLPRGNDTGSGSALAALGDALYGQRRFDEALDAWNRLVADSSQGEHAAAIDVGQYSLRVAKALVALKRCADARDAIARTHDLRRRFPGTGPAGIDIELAELDTACASPGP